MAWRGPRFAYRHYLREAGVGAALASVNAFAAGHGAEFLIDERVGYPARFAASLATHELEWDFGSAGVFFFDRLWIPPGHNLAGLTSLDVYSGTTSPASTLIGQATGITAGEPIDLALTLSSGRFVRFDFVGTGAWELHELFLSKTFAPIRGPEPGWDQEPRSSVLRFEKPSGVVPVLELGPQRQRLAFDFRNVSGSGTDVDGFADLFAYVGQARPFLVDPPYDSDYAVWAHQSADPRIVQDAPNPASTGEIHQRITIQVLESIA